MALVANGIQRANGIVVSFSLPPPIDKHACGCVDVRLPLFHFIFILFGEEKSEDATSQPCAQNDIVFK